MKLQESSPRYTVYHNISILLVSYIYILYIHTYLLFSRFPKLDWFWNFRKFGGVIGSHLSHLTSETRKPSGVTRLRCGTSDVSGNRGGNENQGMKVPSFFFKGGFGVVGSWRGGRGLDESRGLLFWRYFLL